MTELQRLELKALELVGSLNLRPTLDRAAELGSVLSEVKGLLPKGEFTPWLRRVHLNDRTARDYMQVFREYHVGDRRPAAVMTIKQFLAWLRDARLSDKRRENEAVRAAVADRLGRLPDAIQLHRRDCRRFPWPDDIACICTDPPWKNLDCYRWLAGMAAGRLRDGGVMLLQCGTGSIPDVLSIMLGAGLVYRWCMAIVYHEKRKARPTGSRFLSAWKPVLMFSRGPMPQGEYVGDYYTVTHSRDEKKFHDWEQPTGPFRYWLERLVRPGELVCDPFAGSGTTGVACRELALRWIGTEVDAARYKVARGRLAGTKPVKPYPEPAQPATGSPGSSRVPRSGTPGRRT